MLKEKQALRSRTDLQMYIAVAFVAKGNAVTPDVFAWVAAKLSVVNLRFDIARRSSMVPCFPLVGSLSTSFLN
jgi:hypothetical protein